MLRPKKEVCDKCHLYFSGMIGISIKNGKMQKFVKGKICMMKAIGHYKGVPSDCPYYTEQVIFTRTKKNAS
jgi:hypothetical protein